MHSERQSHLTPITIHAIPLGASLALVQTRQRAGATLVSTPRHAQAVWSCGAAPGAVRRQRQSAHDSVAGSAEACTISYTTSVPIISSASTPAARGGSGGSTGQKERAGKTQSENGPPAGDRDATEARRVRA